MDDTPTGPLWTPERVEGDVELALWRAGVVAPGPETETETVLCLHGISSQHRSFNDLASYLAADGSPVSLAALDLRGRGDSAKPEVSRPESDGSESDGSESSYGLDVHVSDVARAIEHLGLRRVVLCGHSMGAFVALRFAALHPDRVSALVLLDGGWPRVEREVSEEESEAVREGLARAFSRLDMTFDSPEAYLDFWFPGQGLSPADLPPTLADYYLYDLEKTADGYRPKTSRPAAEFDSDSVAAESLTEAGMRAVRRPVALVRAAEGFLPGTDPLISEGSRRAMTEALDVRREVSLKGANHYTMMWQPNVAEWASLVSDLDWT